MTAIAWTLWRGELRAQRLVSRRAAVAALQLAFAGSVLVLLTFRVHALVSAGEPPITNVAVLVPVGLLLIFANVVVTGQESGARVADIRRWALPLPITEGQIQRLLVLVGVMRSALFTLTIVGSACVGAMTAVHGWTTRAEIVLAALILPLLPVTAGLWFGVTRLVSVTPALVTAPLAVATVVVAFPLPAVGGAGRVVVHTVAVPGLVLLGAAPAATAAVTLAVFGAGAAWCLLRLTRAIETPGTAAERPPGARLLGAGRIPVTVALALHRIRPRDFAESGVLVAILSVVAAGLLALGRNGDAAPIFALAVFGVTATSVGYQQIRTATALPAEAEAWTWSLPLPARSVARIRHLAGCLGAAYAIALLLTVVTVSGQFLGFVVPLPAVIAVALTPITLGGWLGLGSGRTGVVRLLLLGWISCLTVSRGIVAAVLSIVGCRPSTGAVLIAADVLLGVLGHLAIWRVNGRNR